MNITRISQYALEVLNHHRHGIVHSVYKKTINLCFDQELLAIQVTGSVLSPLSLITDQGERELSALSIKPGDPVLVTAWSKKLLIGTDCFHWDAPEIMDLTLPKPAPDQIVQHCQQLSDTVRSLLDTYPPVGLVPLYQASKELLSNSSKSKVLPETTPFSTENDLPLTEADPFLAKAADLLRTHAPLSSLIGLGIGLTPSGDDFLCGVLAGLIFLGKKDTKEFLELIVKISENLSRTNPISGAFLRCAMKGQFSEALVTLGTVPFAQSEKLFHAIGHSSGADTLCGLYFAFGKYSSTVVY